MKLEDFKKGQSYNQGNLDEVTGQLETEETASTSSQSYGFNRIGEFFTILKDESDCVVSFVLTGWTQAGNIYECIFTDFKED